MFKEHPSLSSDNPLKHPDEDELGYTQFAEQLARAIMRMAPDDGIVMSINGPWGSGKSTVLNFMINSLEKVEEDKRPIIVRFNPWWFSGHEDLTRLLIGQLQARLGDKDYSDLKGKLADLADLASKIPVLPGHEVAELFAKKLREAPDLTALKEKIDDLLLSQSRKILVIVDDIDRLDSSEILDLFRTIKATANFSNVIYLLAFDTRVVVEALEQSRITSGQQYLEKIVQVPFELPYPDRVDLQQLFFNKLDQIIAGTPEYLFDQMDWMNVYYDGIGHFVSTPRKIIRLINTLRTTYPSVQGEVNPVDFIAVESLRIFRPEIYDIIRGNKNLLTGSSEDSSTADSLERQKAYENWIQQVPETDREAIKCLLSRLFPKFGELFRKALYSSRFSSAWRKELRVCSPDIFPVYFRFSVSRDAVTALTMRLLLETAHNALAFENELLRNTSIMRRDGTTKARAILDWLKDYTDENNIPTENVESIVSSFFNIGDKLLRKEDEKRGVFDFGNDIRIQNIIFRLLFRFKETQRFNILYNVIKQGSALSLSNHVVSVLGQQHGKLTNRGPRPVAEQVVNLEHLESLEQLMVAKFLEATERNILLKTPKMASILYRWKDWTGSDREIKQWVSEITKEDENLAIFIERFGNTNYVSSYGNSFSKAEFRVEPKRLEPFIDPETIIERVRGISNRHDLPGAQIEAAKQFVNEYDLLSQGIDPDD